MTAPAPPAGAPSPEAVEKAEEIVSIVGKEFAWAYASISPWPMLRHLIARALDAAHKEALEEATKVAKRHDLGMCDCPAKDYPSSCSHRIAVEIRALNREAK